MSSSLISLVSQKIPIELTSSPVFSKSNLSFMLKQSTLLLSLLFLLFNSGKAQDTAMVNAIVPEDPSWSAEQLDLIFNQVKGFPSGTQFSIALVEKEKVRFLGVLRDRDTIIHVNNSNRVFEIGSISKVFTSILLADQVINNGLNKDTEVATLLEMANQPSFSLAQLANHTSGLPRMPANFMAGIVDPTNPFKGYSQSLLEDLFINNLSLESEPGKKYAYSNIGAGTLGYLLTMTSGKTYEELLQSVVLQKLGMTTTSSNYKNVAAPIVRGLNKDGKEVSQWDFDVLVGAGGILSTTQDLSKFVQAQFDPTDDVMAFVRNPTFTVNDRLQLGLGWHILTRADDTRWHWHNGGTGGYTSSLAVDLKNEMGVIVLSNVSAYNPDMVKVDPLCFSLLQKIIVK